MRLGPVLEGVVQMNLVRQPDGSSYCGQACVAMIAGVSLEDALAACKPHPRGGGTVTPEVVAALRKFGVRCADRRCRRVSREKPVLPQRALLSIMRPKRNRWHWMVTWDGVIYDPADRWPEYEGWRTTSYLEILG
jgi:hypothetical protein